MSADLTKVVDPSDTPAWSALEESADDFSAAW